MFIRQDEREQDRINKWMNNVRSSVQITADVRTIVSRVFATKSSLRFPRVLHIREDKSYLDVQTQDDLFKLLDQNRSNGGGESFLTQCCVF